MLRDTLSDSELSVNPRSLFCQSPVPGPSGIQVLDPEVPGKEPTENIQGIPCLPNLTLPSKPNSRPHNNHRYFPSLRYPGQSKVNSRYWRSEPVISSLVQPVSMPSTSSVGGLRELVPASENWTVVSRSSGSSLPLNAIDWRKSASERTEYKIPIAPSQGCKRCGVIFIEKPNLFLVVQGRDSGIWSFPKGRMSQDKNGEINESEEDCALREVREETGVILKSVEGMARLVIGKNVYFVHPTTQDSTGPLTIHDTLEVGKAEWKTANELRRLRANKDVRAVINPDPNHNHIYQRIIYGPANAPAATRSTSPVIDKASVPSDTSESQKSNASESVVEAY